MGRYSHCSKTVHTSIKEASQPPPRFADPAPNALMRLSVLPQCHTFRFELYHRKQRLLTTNDILVFDGDAEPDVMPSPGNARLRA
jgi:hypothetical protein